MPHQASSDIMTDSHLPTGCYLDVRRWSGAACRYCRAATEKRIRQTADILAFLLGTDTQQLQAE